MKKLVVLMLAACFLAVMLVGISVAAGADSSKATTPAKVEAAKKGAGVTADEKTFPVRNPKNKFVTLETSMGKMTLELYHDVAPAHADSFAARSADGFYSNMIFHRIIDGFMIQGGDPKGDGTGGANYNLKAEFNDLPHQEGTLSMARGNDPNSASTQFFICLGRTASLDGKYTVFGQLVKGFEVLHKIGKVPVIANKFGEKSQPVTPVKLIKAYVSDAQGNPKK